MRGINESHYLSDEHSVFSASDVEGSLSGPHGNIYEVEHLATFQLSEELALPADGMRRLLHMEKNGFGIWSQKMRIRLENRYIVILDFENGEEMERFPLHLIRDPTAFTNPNPGELYNNIFAFIVHPVEMHIFQCFNISAADLVEDVKMALSGRVPPPRQRHGSQNSLPPPPNNPPPEPPMYLGNDVRDDTSSAGSEGKYEREVNILNRCFDDIERFIARLQFAAAAWRELQRRRKSKKSKKKEHGEGLMSMRAKPPREREFVDILQKFKLSFNLLARLKSHIHDPNAPELVHFLFTPLALIVDASRDAHTVGLAACVVSPLLTREAIELLNNCLTSKETELWHSLGESWLLARDQFKGYVPPYQPVFQDGWSPTIPDSSSASIGAAAAAEARAREMEAQREREMREREEQLKRERSISPEIVVDDFGSGQRAFADSVRSHGGRVVVVTHPRTANNHKELTVVRGEYLEVLDDSKKWWKARNWKGQVAHVPHTIVSEMEPSAYHASDNGRSAHSNWTPPSSSMESEDDGYSGNSNSRRVRSQSPPPPPPPPNRVSNSPAPYKQERPLNEAVMHIELGNVLAMLRSQPRIEVTKTPDVYISQKSTPSEVKSWLKAKGFPDKIVKTLGGMDGNELFALTKKQLEDICGKEEGRRLDSQITVSRNFSGYKTARSSELRAILDKARARAENGKDEHDAPAFKSKSAVSASDAVTESNTRKNAAKSRPRVYQQSTPPPPPPVPPKASNYNADSSDEIFSSDDDGKSTLGRMLRQKRGEMLRKN